MFPSKKFGIPGAKPASKTTVTSLFLAILSKDNKFSGENDISTMFFFNPIIVFNKLYPRWPGTATKTISAGF